MFLLTEKHLHALWSLNNFAVPRDRWVFFGLRGCLPASDEDHRFAAAHAVKVEGVDNVHPRCTIGQWQPGVGFALFAGSTVPHRKHIEASRLKGGAETNQLLTGFYLDYRKGKHKAESPTGHDAFRQANKLPIQRSADDLDYDADDRVEFEQPFDNIHAAWSPSVDHDSYASAGCQVVVGFPQCKQRDNHPDAGPWKTFKDNAYAIAQTSFPYVLLTGRDAERVVQSATPLTPVLRYGSKGPLVTLVQEALKQRRFYEGEIDDDFGMRTLTAVLAFQTAEFGPRADDGIVGKQTASALGLDWPNADNGGAAPRAAGPAPVPAAPAPAAPAAPAAKPTAPRAEGVVLVGDRAVAPDGTRFAKRFKKGVFAFGTTSIVDFVRTHRAAFPGTRQSLLNVIESVSQNEGKLEAVNTWDDAFMTFGIFQWTAGTGVARGELAALLDRFKRDHAAAFEELFGRYGLNVHQVTAGPPTSPGVTPAGSLSLDGEILDTIEKKERLRTLDWAYRFWLAGQNDALRIIQIKQAMDRVHIFYRSAKHLINGRQIADYVTSEAGVALLLDQHVNRPGHVPKTLSQAVANVPFGTTNPAAWTDQNEKDLLNEYIELRAATSMTDSDKRAQTVLEAATRGVVSGLRGSFDA